MADYSIFDNITDLNGDSYFTEDVAALGYIEDWQKLAIPEGMAPGSDLDTVLQLSKDGQKIWYKAQVVQLQKADRPLRDEAIKFIAMLRTFMVSGGGTARDLKDRHVHQDEYIMNVDYKVGAEDARWVPTKELYNWMRTYWEQVVAVVAHVFRVRGHHWKPEYASLYENTWKATTIDSCREMPPWEDIARTGLHCFGVAALEKVTERAASAGRLAKALMMRRNAAPAGTAPILTSVAVIDQMRGNTWWSEFYVKLREIIDDLQAKAKDVAAAGLSAHVNASLYGLTKVDVDENEVVALAPYLKGYVDSLPRGASIKGQKALNKRAADRPDLVENFRRVIETDRESLARASTMSAFLAAL